MESDSAFESESESKSETESESESELSWQTAGGNSQDCVFGIGIYGGEEEGKGAGFGVLTLHLKQRSRT